ncbi:MAG: bactofilin family protein [Desulfobulbaceae bacterium]
MSFFRKQDPSRDNTGRAGEVISSILAKDMRVKGELLFKGKARLDGVVEGNIRGEHLVLSESGRVHGDLELVNLICHGTVEGNIKAQQVTIHETAVVHGNLAATSLTVEPGARLNGEITSSQQQAAAQSSGPPAPEPDKD